MKRVLVTGAAGFIGTRATAHLLAKGYEVHAIGRTRPHDDRITFHFADILDIDATRKVMADLQATHLLHLAWNVTPGQYWTAAVNLDWVGASLHLVKAFVMAGGQRAVFAGTCSEYQWGSPRFFELQTPCIPATFYGTAKDALCRLLVGYGVNTGLSVGWGRIFYLYGPGEKPGRLVSDAIQALLRSTPFPTSPGEQMRDFLHVDDVAGAFAALVDCDVQGPVNIGSGMAVPVRTILEKIAALIGHAECLRFGERILPATEPAIVEADTTRLTREVGFLPRYGLDAGLADTIASWKG
ncbi:NAD-dependent epimerase/dehydratase family protein [Methyloferula stellata]|uniref:NAD-dependent epimerase/dehydratase family protein n=1 Tax=Methyloferula stellata TaxID=876270 RepID=UPI00036EED89|nr:NAD(P)-dependent oxidoreductase [Methyloferula stellata]